MLMKRFYTWIDRLNQLLWERVVASTSLDVKSLSAFRIVAGLFLLLFFSPNFNWIAEAPQALFNPPALSIANIFDGFPGRFFFLTLDCVALLSLICIIIGIKARASTIVYTLMCIVGLNFQYSFGKIDHFIMTYALLFCMSFSGWGCHLAVLSDKKTKFDSATKSLSLFSILLCFGMFTAGFSKALNWIDFDTTVNGFLGWSQRGLYISERHYLLAPYVNTFPPAVLELFDYSAVVFELSPLLLLLYSKKAWRLWLLVACSFHFANTLLLNIPFIGQCLVYLVFIDFKWLYNKLLYLIDSLYFRFIAAGAIVSLLLFRGALILNQSFFSAFLSPSGEIKIALYVGLAIWGTAITLVAGNLIQMYTFRSYSKLMKGPKLMESL